ncbi:MAG TPA: TIGR02996 domain-containing protein, partial [Gemmataceae bacterium]|nr:TIGR02996 domain-containing protein [Gemmataceae bacterium]
MSDREALLRAIVAAREEDTPRLAFADWLDEHGDENDRRQAEFIRVQIALVRQEAHSRAWRQAAARNKELLDLRRQWVPPEIADCPLWRVYEFERGFVGHVQLYGQAQIEGLPGGPITYRYVDFADAWFAAAPITSVALFPDGMGSRGSIAWLLDHPTFRHVRRLDLTDCSFRPREVGRLADAANAAGLRELVLTGSGIDSQSVRLLARRAGFTNLARLDLSRSQNVSPDSLTELLDSARFGRLTDLSLRTNPHLGDETAALVARSAVAPRLKRLVLSECSIGPVGVRALLEDDRLAALESLA